MCPFVHSGECDVQPCESCFMEKCKSNPLNNDIAYGDSKISQDDISED